MSHEAVILESIKKVKKDFNQRLKEHTDKINVINSALAGVSLAIKNQDKEALLKWAELMKIIHLISSDSGRQKKFAQDALKLFEHVVDELGKQEKEIKELKATTQKCAGKESKDGKAKRINITDRKDKKRDKIKQ